MTAPPAGPRRRQQDLDALEPYQPPSWDAELEVEPDDGRHEARLFLAFLACLLVITIVAWLAGA